MEKKLKKIAFFCLFIAFFLQYNGVWAQYPNRTAYVWYFQQAPNSLPIETLVLDNMTNYFEDAISNKYCINLVMRRELSEVCRQQIDEAIRTGQPIPTQCFLKRRADCYFRAEINNPDNVNRINIRIQLIDLNTGDILTTFNDSFDRMLLVDDGRRREAAESLANRFCSCSMVLKRNVNCSNRVLNRYRNAVIEMKNNPNFNRFEVQEDLKIKKQKIKRSAPITFYVGDGLWKYHANSYEGAFEALLNASLILCAGEGTINDRDFIEQNWGTAENFRIWLYNKIREINERQND